MNILTENRIIEAGDEYRNNGDAWKPVPFKDVGLQVRFTDYKEVRRPKEQSTVTVTLPSISPDSETPMPKAAEIVTAKAESDNAPVPSHSGTGDTLPTVISPKAHKGTTRHPTIYETIIDYTPSIANRPPKWIGRNGTFIARGLRIRVGSGGFDNGIVGMVPVGKRGLARNAIIEFPAEIIPHVIEFLEKHRPQNEKHKL